MQARPAPRATTLPLWDTHTHVQPSAHATDAYFARNGITGAHPSGTVADLIRQMDACGVERAMIVSWIPARQLVEDAVAAGRDRDAAVADVVREWRELNAWAVAAARAHPERFDCVVGLEPALMSPDVLRAEVESGLAAGATGLKVAPFSLWMHADDPLMEPVWQLATSHDVPVLSECGAHPQDAGGDWGHPKYFPSVLRSYPTLRLQLAHAGIGGEDTLIELMGQWPGVVTDTALRLGSMMDPGYTRTNVVELIRRLGIDRVMFGSCFPLGDVATHAAELRSLPLTDDELYAVAYGNAAHFFRRAT